LQQLQFELSGDFVLSQNIDCHGVDFQPIGSLATPFMGSLDGGKFRLTGISVTQMASDYVGLFGYVFQAKISNLQVSAKVNGNSFVGILAGAVNSSVVVNVTVSGGIISGPTVGGLAGAVMASKISNCTSSAVTLSNGGEAGGLIGRVVSSTVTRCSASGSVSAACPAGAIYASTPVGGLIGSVSGAPGKLSFVTESWSSGPVGGGCVYTGGLIGYGDASTNVQNSYSTSNVSVAVQSESPGGLLGGGTSVFIANCYAGGAVICTNSGLICHKGGLVGCSGSAQLVGTHYDSNKTADQCGEAGDTTEQMMRRLTFQDWDFSLTWGIDETISYPYLLLL